MCVSVCVDGTLLSMLLYYLFCYWLACFFSSFVYCLFLYYLHHLYHSPFLRHINEYIFNFNHFFNWNMNCKYKSRDRATQTDERWYHCHWNTLLLYIFCALQFSTPTLRASKHIAINGKREQNKMECQFFPMLFARYFSHPPISYPHPLRLNYYLHLVYCFAFVCVAYLDFFHCHNFAVSGN